MPEKPFTPPRFDEPKPAPEPIIKPKLKIEEPVKLAEPKPTDDIEKSMLYNDIQRILNVDYKRDEASIPKEHEYWDMIERYKRM